MLSSASIKKAFKSTVQKWGGKKSTEAFHEVGDGALYVALSIEGQVTVTWDGAESVGINIFTYDEMVDHSKAFVTPFTDLLPNMSLMLKDEQPRGYGKVMIKSERVNNDESPDCYDQYKLCPSLAKQGKCDGGRVEQHNAKEWMLINCQFSCKHCNKNSSSAKSEL